MALFPSTPKRKTLFSPRADAPKADATNLFGKEVTGTKTEEKQYIAKLELEALEEQMKEEKKVKAIREHFSQKPFDTKEDTKGMSLFSKGANALKKGYNLFDEVVERTARGVISGAAGTIGDTMKGIEWVGNKMGFEGVGDDTAKFMDTWGKRIAKEDPAFADKLAQGAGSALTFFVPGLGIGKGVGMLAKASPKIAFLFANSASTALEAMSEAGGTWEENKRMGKSDKEADDAADKTFLANAALIFFTNKLGVFGDGQKTIMKRALMSAPMEALQEFGQSMIQNSQTERPLFEGAGEAALIGGILGGGMGVATEAAGLSTPAPQAQSTLQSYVEQALQGAEAQGVAPAPVASVAQESQAPTPFKLQSGKDITLPEGGFFVAVPQDRAAEFQKTGKLESRNEAKIIYMADSLEGAKRYAVEGSDVVLRIPPDAVQNVNPETNTAMQNLPEGMRSFITPDTIDFTKTQIVEGDSLLKAKEPTASIFTKKESATIEEAQKTRNSPPPAPEGKGNRRFLEKLTTDPNVTPALQEGVSNMPEMQYEKTTNPETINQAREMIAADLEGARKMVRDSKGADPLANAVAMELVDTFQKNGRVDDALDILRDWAPQGTTKTAQALQILSAWGRLTPAGALRFAERVTKQAGVELKPEEAQKIADLANDLEKLPEGYEKDLKTAQLLDAVQKQVPAGWEQRIESLQTLAQLLNPKTWVRNILGNMFMVPMEGASNLVSAPIDVGVSLFTGERTKVAPSWLRGKLSGVEATKMGFERGVREAILGVDTKGISKRYQSHSQVFTKGGLAFAEKVLNVSLKSVDRAAYERSFAVSMENQMQVRGLEMPDAAVIEEAHYDGLRAIYENENFVVKGFVGLKKIFNLGRPFGLGSIILKYPRIPANLIVRGLEFSPVGFAKSAFELAKPFVGQEFRQKRFVESLSRATVGSAGAFGLGYYLFQLGILSGAPEEDKDMNAAKKAMGMGMYKLNISALRRLIFSGFNPKAATTVVGDYQISYDWAQPMAMTISMGASFADKNQDIGGISAAVLSSTLASVDTIEQQPLLMGVKRLMLRDPQSAIRSVVLAALDAPASFVPSVLRQMNQFLDNSVPETYDPNPIVESLNRTVASFPGLSRALPRRPDVTTGKDQERMQDGSNSFVNVFFNPAFISQVKNDPALAEVLRLYDTQGESRQAPRIVAKKVTINGEKRSLTSGEFVNYQRYVAENTRTIFDQMVEEKKFEKLSDEQRIDAMAKIVKDVNSAALIVLFGHRPSSASLFTRTIVERGSSDNKVARFLKKEILSPSEAEGESRSLKRFYRKLEGEKTPSAGTLFSAKKTSTKSLFGN